VVTIKPNMMKFKIHFSLASLAISDQNTKFTFFQNGSQINVTIESGMHNYIIAANC
jgi:hypothetical protein